MTQALAPARLGFKPFIYSAALEKGFTPATIINDAPLSSTPAQTGGQRWEPKNYDGKFDGPMRLRTALAKSKNMVSIRILQAIGPQYAQDYITRFGFDPKLHPAYLTMALGAGLGDAAADGRAPTRCSPTAATASRRTSSRKITDNRATSLSEAKPDAAGEGRRARDRCAQRLHHDDAAAGRGRVRHGGARACELGAHRPRRQDRHHQRLVDAWFCGFNAGAGRHRLDRLRPAADRSAPTKPAAGGAADLDRLHAAQR